MKGGAIVTNTRLLKAQMVLYGDTIQTLADHLGINRQNASIKINGRREFKQSEIAKIVTRYNLKPDDMREIFLMGA